MADRPFDWSALGYDSDPVPGDPVVVRAGGQHYVEVADAMQNAANMLNALDAGSSTGSQSVEALLKDRDNMVSEVTVAMYRYREAGEALIEYAYVLDRSQSVTYEALVIARNALESAAEARRLAGVCDAQAREGDGLLDDDVAAGYARRAAAHLSQAADYDAQVAAQKQVAAQAVADLEAAAQIAIGRIRGATSSDGLNDSWWDDIGAKIVAIIADIADWVSTIAGILALIASFIPIIGPAIAGVLFAISAIAAIVAAVCNIVLAATGERSWQDAVFSILGAVLGCLGLKAVGGALGKMAFKSIMNAGGKMAAKESVGGLGSLLIRGLMRPGALGRIAGGNALSVIRGRIGEEIINVVSNTGKDGYKVFDPLHGLWRASGQPDGVLRLFGVTIVGESKNVGWNTVKPGVIGATQQMREYIDLAFREGGGDLRLFVNNMTNTKPLMSAIGDMARIPNGGVIITQFEDVLGTKIAAWVQATIGTGLRLPVMLGLNP